MTNEVKNVLICGLGAVGSIYANKINEFNNKNLKILVDEKRLKKYTDNPKIFNGKPLCLDYILPQNTDYKADLIIIATKYNGLCEAIKNIKNFVKEDTIIISLLNGVTSEEIISQTYGWKHTLLAYFVGHSAMRNGNNISFDGIGKIVFGIKDDLKTDKNDIYKVKKFFDKCNIDYEIPDDMLRSYWLKYMLNVASNQPSAILDMTFGQMQNSKQFIKLFKNIMNEVVQIAKAEGIKNTETMIPEALSVFNKMMSEGKTSMLQDIEAKRKTEVEIFAGDMIKFGEKHHIPTPYNIVLKELIEVLENKI